MNDDQLVLMTAVDQLEQAVSQMLDSLQEFEFVDKQRIIISRVHWRHFLISTRNAIAEGPDQSSLSPPKTVEP